MKETITKAVEELNNSGTKEKSFVGFSHKAKGQNKSFKGKVFFNAVGIMDVELSEIKGYSVKYVHQNVKNLFIDSVLPYPQKNDVVWTDDGGGLWTPGETYTLGGNTYYYGVGSSILNCNGRRFYQDVKAIYVKKEIGTCNPGAARNYNLFKLI